MSTLLTAMQSSTQAKLVSQQFSDCLGSEWSNNTSSIISSVTNNGQTTSVCLPTCINTHSKSAEWKRHIVSRSCQHTLWNVFQTLIV